MASEADKSRTDGDKEHLGKFKYFHLIWFDGTHYIIRAGIVGMQVEYQILACRKLAKTMLFFSIYVLKR